MKRVPHALSGPHPLARCCSIRARRHRELAHQLCARPCFVHGVLRNIRARDGLQGAKVDQPDTKNRTPLRAAAQYGHGGTVKAIPRSRLAPPCGPVSQLAQLLLDAGATVNIVDDKGRTPLFSAARYRHAGTVALLLCRQADMNLADVKQRTPLLAAAEHGHINTINLLLEKGANYLACDSKGRSALHEAAQNGHELCTALLCRLV